MTLSLLVAAKFYLDLDDGFENAGCARCIPLKDYVFTRSGGVLAGNVDRCILVLSLHSPLHE
jgi:hypothetical protein